MLVCWILLFSALLSAPSAPLTGHPGDEPALFAHTPAPTPMIPGGGDAPRETSDPDVETLVRVWPTSAVPPMIEADAVERLFLPGYPEVLDRPPQA